MSKRKDLVIQKGFVFEVEDTKLKGTGLFSFNRWIKKALNRINVPFIDDCCEDETSSTPVRYNDGLERYDRTTAAWVSATNEAGGMLMPFYPQAAQNNIAAAAGGAISVTNYLTTINTDAGGDTFTLADGTQKGQLKKILLVVDGGGDGVVTPANLAAGTTLTFNDAGDFVILQWNGTDWVVLENSGATLA